jgi:hypothetical protein
MTPTKPEIETFQGILDINNYIFLSTQARDTILPTRPILLRHGKLIVLMGLLKDLTKKEKSRMAGSGQTRNTFTPVPNEIPNAQPTFSRSRI